MFASLIDTYNFYFGRYDYAKQKLKGLIDTYNFYFGRCISVYALIIQSDRYL